MQDKAKIYFRHACTIYLTCISFFSIYGQDTNVPLISGNLNVNANIFIRDSVIGAANIPQYDRQLFGAESWLDLNYSYRGFDFGLRFDLFNNSNLLNPNDSYSAEGIGRWFIQKRADKLGITVGYLYDQLGSGIIFRAYEERPLSIDNALIGLRLTYALHPNWEIKAFTGRQKQLFDRYASVIKGFGAEGFIAGGDETEPWSFAPGFGFVNRTYDDATMNSIVSTLNTYQVGDIFVPRYNAYAFTLYNTLNSGPFSWYLEAALKTDDILVDPFGRFDTGNGELIGEKLIQQPGSVLYSSLSYADKGLGITVEAKRTSNFDFRTRPQEQLNLGIINFLPPLTRINTYRLTSRYAANTQFIGEMAFLADIRYAYKRKWLFSVNYSNMTNLYEELLYREWQGNIQYKNGSKWSILGGLQSQVYNQAVFEFKPGVPNVETWIPYLDFLYRIDRKKSVRLELQTMVVGEDPVGGGKQDYGNWWFGMVEFTLAPNWTFAVADMYNSEPGVAAPADASGEGLKIHYPRVDVYYNYKSSRFSLSYIKQVAGIVCAGGICRLEPAFSGVRLNVNTSF